MSHPEPISGLLLDETNPRFEEQVDSQEAALTAVIRDAPSKLINLAKDIARLNSLNPTELPIVIDGEGEGELIVIEGNRRIAALKLLRNPELAQAASDSLGLDLVGQFREIAQLGIGPDNVEVVWVEDRDAARHWIELRHTGENDGIGVLEWQSWQANNYRRRKGSHSDRAALFCSAIEVEFPDNDGLLALVTELRRSRLTTLGRLIADPDVRYNIGLEFDDDQVFFYYDSGDLLPIVLRIFKDLSGKKPAVSVTNIKTKGQRSDYINGRVADLPDQSHRLLERRQAGDRSRVSFDSGGNNSSLDQPRSDNQYGTEQSSSENASENEKPGKSTGGSSSDSAGNGDRQGKRATPLENVIFKGLKLPHFSAEIQSLLFQAQKINIVDFPRVTGILVRIMVELVCTEAIAKNVVPGAESDHLKAKIAHALIALDPEIANPPKRDKSLEMAWTSSQDPNGMAVQSLNAYIHNPYGSPTASDVRALSSHFRPLLERLNILVGTTKS